MDKLSRKRVHYIQSSSGEVARLTHVAHVLLQKRMLLLEEYDNIQCLNTMQEKTRNLIDLVKKRGDKPSRLFMKTWDNYLGEQAVRDGSSARADVGDGTQ